MASRVDPVPLFDSMSRLTQPPSQESLAMQERNSGLVIRRVPCLAFRPIGSGQTYANGPTTQLGLILNVSGVALGQFIFPIAVMPGTVFRQLSLRAELQDQLNPGSQYVKGELLAIADDGTSSDVLNLNSTSTGNAWKTDTVSANGLQADSTKQYAFLVTISLGTGYTVNSAAALWLELQYTTPRFSGQ